MGTRCVDQSWLLLLLLVHSMYKLGRNANNRWRRRHKLDDRLVDVVDDDDDDDDNDHLYREDTKKTCTLVTSSLGNNNTTAANTAHLPKGFIFFGSQAAVASLTDI